MVSQSVCWSLSSQKCLMMLTLELPEDYSIGSEGESVMELLFKYSVTADCSWSSQGSGEVAAEASGGRCGWFFLIRTWS